MCNRARRSGLEGAGFHIANCTLLIFHWGPIRPAALEAGESSDTDDAAIVVWAVSAHPLPKCAM